MTIDEAIEKENAIIKHEQFFQDTHIVFTDDDGEDVTIDMLHCDDTECIEESLEISRNNLEYHQQLINWLEELKNYRDGDYRKTIAYQKGYSKAENDYFQKCEEILQQQFNNGENYGYNRAIDDFDDKICTTLEEYQTGFNMVSMANVWHFSKEIAEQLKEKKHDN